MEKTKLRKFAKAIKNSIMDAALNKRTSEDELTQLFEKTATKNLTSVFPIYFGSDDFSGFNKILQMLY